MITPHFSEYSKKYREEHERVNQQDYIDVHFSEAPMGIAEKETGLDTQNKPTRIRKTNSKEQLKAWKEWDRTRHPKIDAINAAIYIKKHSINRLIL